jgi:glutamate decarboxylase
MRKNAQALDESLRKSGALELLDREPRLPLVIAKVREDEQFTGRDLVGELAKRRGWMVPAYNLPPANEDEEIMRVLVKINQSRELADALADDFDESITYLRERAAGERPKQPVHTGHGY